MTTEIRHPAVKTEIFFDQPGTPYPPNPGFVRWRHLIWRRDHWVPVLPVPPTLFLAETWFTRRTLTNYDPITIPV
jgi:hypothetical protein